MNTQREMDPMQMCRICAVSVDDDAAPHILIRDNQITELGEIFISCLGIEVSKIFIYIDSNGIFIQLMLICV